MDQIIQKILTEYNISDNTNGKAEYKIKEASIKDNGGTLFMAMELNFVMPLEAEKKLIEEVKRLLGGKIKNVEIKYDYKELAFDREQSIELLIGRAVKSLNASYGSLLKGIDLKKYKLDGKTLTLYVIGEVATNELNKLARNGFSSFISKGLGEDIIVKFENNEAKLQEAIRSSKENEAETIKKSMELYKEDLKREAKINPVKKEEPKANPYKGGWQRKIELPAEGDRIMGTDFKGGPTCKLEEIDPKLGKVIVEGEVFKVDFRLVKSGNYLMSLLITDNTTTILCKAFVTESKKEEIEELVKPGDMLLIRGDAQYDTFENMNSVMVKDIKKTEKDVMMRHDTWEGEKRVELHCHTKMSKMDGLNEPDDIVKKAHEWGQKAIAVTDHGVVQAFPDCYEKAVAINKKLKDGEQPIKVIFGVEGYYFDDRKYTKDGVIDYKTPWTNHIILLVKNQVGMKNLYKLISYSHLDYFHKRPRLPRSVIEANREGIIIGSACEAGELFQAIYHNESHEKLLEIARFYDYLEIQPLINNKFMLEDRTDNGKHPDRFAVTEEDLRNYNRKIVALGEELGIPVCATTDAHYDEESSAIFRNIIMAGQGYKDAESGTGLFMRTTNEMMEEFSYLGEEKAREVVITNTNMIADMVEDGITPISPEKCPPKIDGAEETLRSTCMKNAYETYGNPLPKEIEERLEKELNSIIGNGYAVMYVAAQMLVNRSLEDGYLVGSRGSVGSSFAATMAGITEVNPLDPHYICPKCKHLEWGDMNVYDCGVDMPPKKCPSCGTEMKRDGFTIPFATFLGFEGDKEPDIDLNFAGVYQARAHKYVGEIFGEENVFKAGTVGTIESKTAYGYVRKYYEEIGVPINKYEIDRLTTKCTGIKRTTGQHPGGIVIVPRGREIYEFCPVQRPADDQSKDIVTTHFDYHKIDKNLLKLDILGHNVPSMIRQLQDMTGIDPLDVSLTDRKVLSIFNGTEALNIKDENYIFNHGSFGIPEFGTSFTRQMLDDTKPDKFADLVRIAGFSHGTDVWLNNAQDYIKDGVATMREVISTRDDIMNYLILKGLDKKDAFSIMEHVRKGKGLTEAEEKTMKENKVPEWYMESCKKIKYMFPRAHAVAYTMMSFRMAWYKVYYPLEFYATYLTSSVEDFEIDTILKGKDAVLERMEQIQRIPSKECSAKDKNILTILEVCYEMFARGFEFRDMILGKSHASEFRVYDGKVLLPYMALNGMGRTAATALYEEYEKKPFETIEEVTQRAKLGKASIDALKAHGIFTDIPDTDQLSFF